MWLLSGNGVQQSSWDAPELGPGSPWEASAPDPDFSGADQTTPSKSLGKEARGPAWTRGWSEGGFGKCRQTYQRCHPGGETETRGALQTGRRPWCWRDVRGHLTGMEGPGLQIICLTDS